MVDFRLWHVIHIWKAMNHSYHLGYLETILVRPTRPQNFGGKLHSTFYNICDFVLSNSPSNNSKIIANHTLL